MLAVKNKKLMIIGLIFFLGLVSPDLFGQSGRLTRTRQLEEAVSGGDITLTANGNGSSSGIAVTGRLRNNTSNGINVNINLNGGLYLRNSGTGQNMLAIQVYLADGGYYSDGINQFITLAPNADTQIIFYALCADFKRDNPSVRESFSIDSMRQDIQSIASKINRYINDNFDTDTLVAEQLALWRSQGVSRTDIARTFEFDDADWEIATRIMNY